MTKTPLIRRCAFLALLASMNSYAETCPAWMQTSLGKLHSKDNIQLCEVMHNKVALVVNTASHCGYTRQFSGLERLHQQFKDKGLVVIGFPSDDFNQEADDSAEIAEVCYKNYGVSFTMTDPVSVRGEQAIALFQHLAGQTSQPNWNFNKYVLDAQGKVQGHFSSSVEPDDPRLLSMIESALKQ